MIKYDFSKLDLEGNFYPKKIELPNTISPLIEILENIKDFSISETSQDLQEGIIPGSKNSNCS